jgi:hypothetical protein
MEMDDDTIPFSEGDLVVEEEEFLNKEPYNVVQTRAQLNEFQKRSVWTSKHYSLFPYVVHYGTSKQPMQEAI